MVSMTLLAVLIMVIIAVLIPALLISISSLLAMLFTGVTFFDAVLAYSLFFGIRFVLNSIAAYFGHGLSDYDGLPHLSYQAILHSLAGVIGHYLILAPFLSFTVRETAFLVVIRIIVAFAVILLIRITESRGWVDLDDDDTGDSSGLSQETINRLSERLDAEVSEYLDSIGEPVSQREIDSILEVHDQNIGKIKEQFSVDELRSPAAVTTDSFLILTFQNELSETETLTTFVFGDNGIQIVGEYEETEADEHYYVQVDEDELSEPHESNEYVEFFRQPESYEEDIQTAKEEETGEDSQGENNEKE